VINAPRGSRLHGALTVAMTGVAESLLAGSAEVKLVTEEGPEITFPKTKGVVACAGLLMRLGLGGGSHPGTTQEGMHLDVFRGAPFLVRNTIETVEPHIKSLMPSLSHLGPVHIGGTGSGSQAPTDDLHPGTQK